MHVDRHLAVLGITLLWLLLGVPLLCQLCQCVSLLRATQGQAVRVSVWGNSDLRGRGLNVAPRRWWGLGLVVLIPVLCGLETRRGRRGLWHIATLGPIATSWRWWWGRAARSRGVRIGPGAIHPIRPVGSTCGRILHGLPLRRRSRHKDTRWPIRLP